MKAMPVLPPEARLVVFATRPSSGEDDRALDALLTAPLDWRRVGELAEREKLLPVLWNRLRGHAAGVPREIADRIHAQAAVTEFRMAMTEVTLQQAVEQLAAENIPVLLLKGAALATTVYPSFAARPMGDVDLLVRPEDAQRAWQLLVDAGWRPELAGGEQFFEGHHHLVGLVDSRGLNLVLEVHRGMLPTPGPFRFDEAEVWRDARAIRLGSSEAWVPSDQHQLLHLCVHFAWSHMLISGIGRTARDVATLLERGDVDWDRFVPLARRTQAASCAYWTLTISRTLAGARVPDRVLEALRPPGSIAAAHALERAQITSALLGTCPSIHLMRLLWSAAIRPRASGHGEVRPWKAGEAFMEAFHLGHRPGRMARLRAHIHGWSAWLHFAGIIGIPRPIV
jgi:hypothetical protein